MTLDPALGHEIKKTRPTLVVQNDINESIIQPASSGLQGGFDWPFVSTAHGRPPDRQRLLKRLGSAMLRAGSQES